MGSSKKLEHKKLGDVGCDKIVTMRDQPKRTLTELGVDSHVACLVTV